MKRTLALPLAIITAAAGTGLCTDALAAGPTVIGSVYIPNVEIASADANPSALKIDIRQSVGRTFWLGAQFATSLSGDEIAPGTDIEVGTSVNIDVGAQAEFSHYVAGYAYVGYGTSEVEASSGGSIDGTGVAWGLGLQFLMADALIADVGYATLFDGDMEGGGGGSVSTTIAGPHVGIGYRF